MTRYSVGWVLAQIEHERIPSHFHQLREFALEHAEANVILAAINCAQVGPGAAATHFTDDRPQLGLS